MKSGSLATAIKVSKSHYVQMYLMENSCKSLIYMYMYIQTCQPIFAQMRDMVAINT